MHWEMAASAWGHFEALTMKTEGAEKEWWQLDPDEDQGAELQNCLWCCYAFHVTREKAVYIPVKNGDINRCLTPENWFFISEFCH